MGNWDLFEYHQCIGLRGFSTKVERVRSEEDEELLGNEVVDQLRIFLVEEVLQPLPLNHQVLDVLHLTLGFLAEDVISETNLRLADFISVGKTRGQGVIRVVVVATLF